MSAGSHIDTPSLVLGLGWFPDQPGGLTRYLRSLTEALADDGRGDPLVVVIGPVGHPPEFVRAVSSADQPLPLRLVRFAVAARREARAARLVDAHFALYAWPCLFVPRIRRLPLVFHFHGPWAAEFVANGERPGLRMRLRESLERCVYRRTDAFVTLSEAFKGVLVGDFGVEPDRVHVLGAGVDLDAFSPGDRAEARAMQAVAPSAWVALAVRRLDARMGLDVLLRAWALVEIPDRMLLIAGDGPMRADLEALASELGLHANVRFLGRVSDAELVTCYRAADVAVVPSVALEGFGLVVLEALGCGVPVVGTDVDGLAETLTRLDPSLVVPRGDATALAARLAAAVTGRLPLPAPSQCRRFAEAFSWRAVADRHRLLYAQVVAAGGG